MLGERGPKDHGVGRPQADEGFQGHAAPRLAALDHEQNAVGQRAQERRISKAVGRGSVEDNEVKMLAQPVDNLGRDGRAEQLAGIGGNGPAGHEAKAMSLGREDMLVDDAVSGQQARETKVCLLLDDKGRFAHVGIDQKNTLAGFGEALGQDEAGRRLAFAGP